MIKNDEKEYIPNIRFPDYESEWKAYLMKELYSQRNEHGNSSLPILSVSIHSGVSDGELDSNSLGKQVRRSEDKSKYKHVYPGDLIFNMMRAWQGAIGVAKSEGMVSPAYISAIPNDKVYPPFMNYLFQRHEMIEQINNLSYGVTDFRKRLYWDSFEKVECKLPSIKEQQAITGFFENLDQYIAINENDLADLKELKKGLLQRMFPAEGKYVPELRFPGFTDSWEQRKLSDVADIYDGVHQTPDYQKSGIMFLSVENIATLTSNKFISEEAFERDYKNYPEKGDILMTRIGDVGTPNVVETDEKVAFYVSLALLKPKNIDSYFLCNAIRSPEFQKGLSNRTLLTAIPQKINKDEIGKVEFFLPKESDEQKKIGEYFKSLDHLITLHQRKLDDLKELKKGLLQEMFI